MKGDVCLSEQLCDVDVNNPPQGSRACSLPAYRTLTPLNAPRPAWQLCCHRVVTCQILMYMQCVLCFSVSCMTTPHHHHLLPLPPSPPCMMHSRPHPHFHPSDTTSPTSPVSPLSSPSLTPLYVLLHGLRRRSPSWRLAWHWPPTPPGPLGHSGRRGVQGLPDQPGLRYRQRRTGT